MEAALAGLSTLTIWLRSSFSRGKDPYPAFRKMRYNEFMILSFKDEEAQKIFSRQWSSKLPRDIQLVAYRKLAMLHSAEKLLDLRSPPGNRLEKLRGERSGQYSIRINDRWSICFEWSGVHARHVEIVD